MFPFSCIFRKIYLLFHSALWRRRFFEAGSDSRIHSPITVNHPKRVVLGNNVSIHSHAWLNCLQKCSHGTSLRIGSNSSIGRFSHINAYEKVVLEEFVLIGERVHISDCSHCYHDPHVPIISQGAEVRGPVLIRRGAWIGSGAVILPSVTIGRNAIVGANAVVTKDVPDFHVAIGVPARILPPKKERSHYEEK